MSSSCVCRASWVKKMLEGISALEKIWFWTVLKRWPLHRNPETLGLCLREDGRPK